MVNSSVNKKSYQYRKSHGGGDLTTVLTPQWDFFILVRLHLYWNKALDQTVLHNIHYTHIKQIMLEKGCQKGLSVQIWFFIGLGSLLLTSYLSTVHTFYDMMKSSNGNIFRGTGHLWGESTSHRWIPHTKASDMELWCFLWAVPEQTAEQRI